MAHHSLILFDAAYEAGANYANMGTWSVPMEEPAYGLGIENSYTEPMTKYNFDRHEQWKKKGQMAVICLGIDPGVVNVFAKYAATHLFDDRGPCQRRRQSFCAGSRPGCDPVWIQCMDGSG